MFGSRRHFVKALREVRGQVGGTVQSHTIGTACGLYVIKECEHSGQYIMEGSLSRSHKIIKRVPNRGLRRLHCRCIRLKVRKWRSWQIPIHNRSRSPKENTHLPFYTTPRFSDIRYHRSTTCNKICGIGFGYHLRSSTYPKRAVPVKQKRYRLIAAS